MQNSRFACEFIVILFLCLAFTPLNNSIVFQMGEEVKVREQARY